MGLDPLALIMTFSGGRGAFNGFGRGSSSGFPSTGYGLESSGRGGFGALQISSSRGGSGSNSQPIGNSRSGFGSTRGGFSWSSNRFTTSETATDWGTGNFSAGNERARGSRFSDSRGKFPSNRNAGNSNVERRVRYAPVTREPEVLFAEDQIVSEKYANVIDEDEEVMVEDFAGEVMTLGLVLVIGFFLNCMISEDGKKRNSNLHFLPISESAITSDLGKYRLL